MNALLAAERQVGRGRSRFRFGLTEGNHESAAKCLKQRILKRFRVGQIGKNWRADRGLQNPSKPFIFIHRLSSPQRPSKAGTRMIERRCGLTSENAIADQTDCSLPEKRYV